MAMACSTEVFAARQAVSRFFNIKNPLRICFTKNATEALNMAIRGYLTKGSHVVTTSMEHNSVMRPLYAAQKEGVDITVVWADSDGYVDANEVEDAITDKTRMVICSLSSNVNGIILPIKDIGEACRARGVAFLADVAQGAGSVKVDVEEMKIDMLAFPGHKGLLGPQGTGGLYIREGLDVEPIGLGGTGSNSISLEQPEVIPDRLESGTLNTPGIVGLRHGVEFIENFGIENLACYKNLVIEKMHIGLESISGIKLYSKPENNSGIVALKIKDMESVALGCLLNDRYGIAARAGLHCSPFAHKTLGTLQTGLLRFSPGCFTTYDDVDYVIESLKNIASGQFNI